MRYKLLALFLLAATVGPAMVSAGHLTGDGNIQDIQVLPTTVSNNSRIAVLVSVSDIQGNPVNTESCDSLSVEYNYNTSYDASGDGKNMSFIDDTNNRFFATLPVSTANTTIDFYADPDLYSGSCNVNMDYIHDNITIDAYRNLSTRFLNATPNLKFVEGKNYSFWTNVSYNDSFHDGADVTWSLHDPNGTQVQTGSFTNWSGILTTNRYNTTLSFPDTTEGRYFLSVEADDTDASFANATGGLARSFIVQTKLEGDLTVIATEDTCESKVNPSECQKGTTFKVFYNITDNDADNASAAVTASLEYGQKVFTSFNLTEVSDGDWYDTFSVTKDFNTSTYGEILTLNVGAKNNLSSDLDSKIFTISPFIVKKADDPVNKYQGDTLTFKLSPQHKFTNIPLERDKIWKFSVAVKNPSGDVVFNRTFGENGTTIPDANYNDAENVFNVSWETASNIEPGEYELKYSVTDIYAKTKGNSWGDYTFDILNDSEESVSDVYAAVFEDGSFQELSTIDERYTHTGLKKYQFLLKNNGSLAANITNVSFSADLVNRTNISFEYEGESNVSTPFKLGGNSQARVKLNFSLETFDNYTGDITFNVTSDLKTYLVSIDTDLEVREDKIPCPFKNGTLCTYVDSIDTSYENAGTQTLTLDVGNRDGNKTNLTVDANGNMTSILAADSVPKTVQVDNNTKTGLDLGLDLSKDDNGFYSGNLTLENTANDTATIPTTITVDIPLASFDISVLGETDFGTVVAGEDSISFTVRINNSGNLPIENLTLESTDLDIEQEIRDDDGNYVELAPNEHVNVTVQSDDLPAGDYTGNSAAEVRVTAAGGASASASVSVTVVENIDDDISSLDSEISTFEQQINSLPDSVSSGKLDDIDSTFTDYKNAVSAARDAWNNGNYEQAETEYGEAQQLKSELDQKISNAQEAPGDDPPETNETNGGEEPPGDGGGGGGFNILLLIIPLIIIVIIGVVIYLSIVPEEEGGGGGEDDMDFGPPQ